MRSRIPPAAGPAVALVLLAFTLRPALASLPPVLTDVQREFGLSATGAGVLTTLPVLFLGLFAAVAPPLARRAGAGAAVLASLALIGAGVLLRVIPVLPALFGGTLLVGAGIGLGNVLLSYAIKSRFPHRLGLLTGVTTMMLTLGAAVAAGLTVPVAEAAGDWRAGLAVWVLPALVAGAAWPAAFRGEPERPAPPGRAGGRLLTDQVAWYVTAFMGMQSLLFYVLVSWLPAIFIDFGHRPAAAGGLLAVSMLLGLPTSLAVPILAARRRSQYGYVIGIGVTEAVAIGGLLATPGLAVVWAVLLGLAQGAAFGLALTLITLRSADGGVAARLSGMAQTAGYLLAATGPFAIGLLHDLSRGWTIPLLALLVWLVPQTIAGLGAARPVMVPHPGAMSTKRL